MPAPAHLPRTRRFALRSGEGGSQFTIRYAGELWEEYNLIVGVGALPALIMAVACDTGEEIVLFDGAVHGLARLVAGAQQVATRVVSESYTSPSGSTEFKIEVELTDEVDWENPAEVAAMPGAARIGLDRLRADGFTALSIAGIDEDDDRVWLVEEDLAD